MIVNKVNAENVRQACVVWHRANRAAAIAANALESLKAEPDHGLEFTVRVTGGGKPFEEVANMIEADLNGTFLDQLAGGANRLAAKAEIARRQFIDAMSFLNDD